MFEDKDAMIWINTDKFLQNFLCNVGQLPEEKMEHLFVHFS